METLSLTFSIQTLFPNFWDMPWEFCWDRPGEEAGCKSGLPTEQTCLPLPSPLGAGEGAHMVREA